MSDEKFRFVFNKEDATKRLSGDDYMALERAADGDVKLYLLLPVMARFLADEGGVVLPHRAAMKRLSALPLNEILSDVFPAFFKTMQDLAVPNTSGDE